MGFKAQAKMDDDALISEAKRLLDRSKCSLVVANKIEDVHRGRTKVVVVAGSGDLHNFEGTKAQVADRVIDVVVRVL